MEIILALLKYFTAALSPVQFLVVLATIAGVSFLVVRWALKRRKAIMSILKPEDENLKLINDKLDHSIPREEFAAAVSKLELTIRHEVSAVTENVKALRHQFVEITALRAEIADKEFADLKDQQEILLSTLKQTNDSQTRIHVQVDHIDEYLKAAVPEFRGYHRELGSDIKMLSRDIALIERSISLVSNNSTAVKLR